MNKIWIKVAIVMVLNGLLTVGVCSFLAWLTSLFNPSIGVVFIIVLLLAMLAVALMTPATKYYYKAKEILHRRKELGMW